MVFGTVSHVPGTPETLAGAASEAFTASNIAYIGLGVVGAVALVAGFKMIATGENPFARK